MEWNDKIEMAKLLNNGNYAEAVEFIKDKEWRLKEENYDF